MDRTQFRGALGVLFAGMLLKPKVVEAIVAAYDAQGLVRWKQFAFDFDEIVPSPALKGSPTLEENLRHEFAVMRRFAIEHRLDLTDAFEEQCGPGRERAMGIMDQTQFEGALRVLFKASLTTKQDVVKSICNAYRASDGTNVRWKQFALDLDNTTPVIDGDVGSPEIPEPLMGDLLEMRRFAQGKMLHLTYWFAEIFGKGTNPRERNLGICDDTQFSSVLNDAFKLSVPQAVLKEIIHVWLSSDGHNVRWRQFATDFDAIPASPSAPPEW